MINSLNGTYVKANPLEMVVEQNVDIAKIRNFVSNHIWNPLVASRYQMDINPITGESIRSGVVPDEYNSWLCGE